MQHQMSQMHYGGEDELGKRRKVLDDDIQRDVMAIVAQKNPFSANWGMCGVC